MSRFFETSEELQQALTKVFNTISQLDDGRPAFRAVARLSKTMLEINTYHRPELIEEYKKEIAERQKELEEALKIHPFSVF